MFSWFTHLKLASMTKKATAMHANRQHNPVSDAITKKEQQLLYEIAALYDKHQFDKKFPHAREYALEAYRSAAALNDANAQYLVGQRLLEQGKFWDLIKTTCYACQVHDRYAKEAYDEAFAYLNAAEAAKHALAKRLKGMAMINGWGIEKNSDQGFSLVVDSIDLENSWARATKIFQDLGLNKPEFFASIMSARQAKTNA